MAWRDRLRKQITLTAPDGTAFSASWAGNDIEAGRMVGQFNAPLRDGTITQDMGSKGLSFPLTLAFEGDDHDTTAWAFLNAFLRQRGNWKVVHPVYGTHMLQAVTGTLSADPTGSGGLTRVETQWVEPADADSSVSTIELGAGIAAQVEQASASASTAFTGGVNLSDAEAQAAAATTGTQALGAFQASSLSKLVQSAVDLQAAFSTAYAGAQAALSAVPMDVNNAAGQIQALMQIPALVQGDLSAKVQAFADCANRVKALLLPGSDSGSRNAAVVGELFLSGCITGACQSAALAVPATREQAVQTITDIRSLFSSITTALDAVQTANAGNQANQQYFSNGISFPDLARLVGLTCAFLLRSLFDLKVAKRFTLTRPRAPIELTITEYGSLGDGDAFLDLFIASNGLRANDIILLPAGREVVVYV